MLMNSIKNVFAFFLNQRQLHISFLPHETWLQVSLCGLLKIDIQQLCQYGLKKIPHLPKWHFNDQTSFAHLTYFINIHFLCLFEWRLLARICTMMLIKVTLLDKIWIISSIQCGLQLDPVQSSYVFLQI